MRAAPLAACLLFAAPLAVPAGAHFNHVTATPQVSPDGVVYVESVFVVDTVWLALHADADGGVGRPIGATLIDPSGGPLTEVAVGIASGVWANTTGARTVWIDLYFDDGDGTFEAERDERLSERGLFSPVPVTVERGDERAYVGARGVTPQRTNGTVEVRRVVLPTEGHLVIRNDAEGTPGAVVGHVTLPAGDHAGVGVRLNRTFLAKRSSTFRLWAVLYADDGDGEFDDGDRPVTAGNETVRSAFRASTRESSPTPTPEESELVTTPTAGSGVEGGETGGTRGAFPGVGPWLVAAAAALVGVLVVGGYVVRRTRRGDR